LIISFDFQKEDYPETSFSIASILAKFSDSGSIKLEHQSYNLRGLIGKDKSIIERRIISEFKNKFSKSIDNYSFIALSAYSWSENLVQMLVNYIRPNFSGKIILGGYEITALPKKELIDVYENVDYYIKGHAEFALEEIFSGRTNDSVLDFPLRNKDLVSPYLTGILPLNTKKIYWESKRGCSYTCGFCEWGNSLKGKVYRLDDDRLDKELELFSKYKFEEINVIDATFLLTQKDIEIFRKLLDIPNTKITFQVRFEKIDSELGNRFLSICEKNRDRVSLEFGLQTIHVVEMKSINRVNNLDSVKRVMSKLNQKEIDYSVSIIYGIPGQTIDSFDETINFIKDNGCVKFSAFPLQIPKNSAIHRNKERNQVKEHSGQSFSLSFVKESYSFTESDWEQMCEKTGQPFIGDPLVERTHFQDMCTSNPGMFIYFKDNGNHLTLEKESELIDIRLEKNNESEIQTGINTIHFKHIMKYSYFHGDIYDIENNNQKYRVKLAGSGNIYLIY